MPYMKNGFEVILASPPEYERLVAEVFFEGKFVALVSQERNAADFDLETPSCELVEETVLRRFELSGFLAAVSHACSRLRGEAT